MSGGSFTFTWPSGPNEVIVTGVFDNWGKTLPLVKQADGSFELTVPLQKYEGKVYYKYLVDGIWLVAPDHKVEKDNLGNDNNYFINDDIVKTSAFGSKIPESGGAFVPVSHKSSELKEAPTGTAKSAVMPVAETEHHTQSTLGEAGIFVPKDQDQLKAFEQVRDVDPKTLNEPEEIKFKVKRSEVRGLRKTDGLSSDDVSDFSGAADRSNVTAPTSSGLDQDDETLATNAAAAAYSKGPDAIENEAKGLEPTPTNGAVKDFPVDSKDTKQGSSATPIVGGALLGGAGAAGLAAAASHYGSGNKDIGSTGAAGASAAADQFGSGNSKDIPQGSSDAPSSGIPVDSKDIPQGSSSAPSSGIPAGSKGIEQGSSSAAVSDIPVDSKDIAQGSSSIPVDSKDTKQGSSTTPHAAGILVGSAGAAGVVAAASHYGSGNKDIGSTGAAGVSAAADQFGSGNSKDIQQGSSDAPSSGIPVNSRDIEQGSSSAPVTDVPVDSKETKHGSSATPFVGGALGGAGAAGVGAAASHYGSGNKDIGSTGAAGVSAAADQFGSGNSKDIPQGSSDAPVSGAPVDSRDIEEGSSRVPTGSNEIPQGSSSAPVADVPVDSKETEHGSSATPFVGGALGGAGAAGVGAAASHHGSGANKDIGSAGTAGLGAAADHYGSADSKDNKLGSSATPAADSPVDSKDINQGSSAAPLAGVPVDSKEGYSATPIADAPVDSKDTKHGSSTAPLVAGGLVGGAGAAGVAAAASHYGSGAKNDVGSAGSAGVGAAADHFGSAHSKDINQGPSSNPSSGAPVNSQGYPSAQGSGAPVNSQGYPSAQGSGAPVNSQGYPSAQGTGVPAGSKDAKHGSSTAPLVAGGLVGGAGAAGVAAAASHYGSGANKDVGSTGAAGLGAAADHYGSGSNNGVGIGANKAAQDVHPEPVVEDFNDFDAPKTLDPKLAEGELEESGVSARPIGDVPIKPINESEPIAIKAVPNTAGNVAPKTVAEVEEIVIADGSISAKEVQAEVQAQEGRDVTLEEFKPSKSEAELIKQADPKTDGKAATDATKATKATPATAATTTKATPALSSKDKKQKKPNALKRFIKKILD